MRAFERDQTLAGAADSGRGAEEGTPLLPPRHAGRRIDGYGGGQRGGHDGDYAEESDGGGWDSDAAGTGGASVGGLSRASRASYTSSRALALPGIFQNLSRCVIPSEHEVVSDGGGERSGSSCCSSEDDESASGEDWEGVGESDEYQDEYSEGGRVGEDDEGQYELSPQLQEDREEPQRTTKPARSKAKPLTSEEMESAYTSAVGRIGTSADVAGAANTARQIDPANYAVIDDNRRQKQHQSQRTSPPSEVRSDGVPSHIGRTPPKKHGSDPLPLPRILPRHYRRKAHQSEQLDGGRHNHRHHHSGGHHHRHRRLKRSIRRRVFLLLTEPQTSIASAAFFVILIVAIALSNILMMLQTMNFFQFTPPECNICGGTNEYYSTNDDTNYFGPTYEDAPIPCECPPVPNPSIVWLEDVIIWFFTVEWILRVVCYEPARRPSEPRPSGRAALVEWSSYLTETTTVLDALAIFPYYLERYEETNGLLSLRLLRLFRVFQLVRLGQYNVTFLCLINVLVQAILSLNLLIIVLVFGAAFFGSMIYWLEKGEWKYTEVTDPPSFAYVRVGIDGVSEEVSPFTSIPASFWWFIVTATTVGYGDTYPTSTGGKCVAALAMLMGVLVIAFPVSVFSDLWSKELQKAGVLRELEEEGGSQGDGETKSTDTEALEKDSSHKCKPGTQLKVPEKVGGSYGETSGSAVKQGYLSQGDFDAIVAHLRVIDESQEKIRNILKKNQHQT